MRQLSRRTKLPKSSMINSTENRNRQSTSGTIDDMINGKKNINMVIPPSEEPEEICMHSFVQKLNVF